MVYQKAKIDFTDRNIMNILKGKPIQLSSNQIAKGGNILIHGENHKKLTKALKMGKGCIITVTPGEIVATQRLAEESMDGNGFFSDAFNWLKKAIKSPLYQNLVKPILGPLVRTAATTFNPTLGAVANTIGNETGAFGLPKPKKVKKVKTNALDGSSFKLAGGSFSLN